MATYQTTYSEAPPIGLPGQVANEEKCNKVSREVETEAGIAFGQPVQRGTDDHGVALLADGDFLGLAVLNPAVPADADNPDAYPQRFTGAFMTMGTMYVTVGEAVTAGAAVYWDAATGRYTVNTSTTDRAIPGAVFDTSASADGDLAIIALNLR